MSAPLKHYPLPPHHAPGEIPSYLVDAARRIMARHGVYLNPQARAWVMALAEWHARGLYAYPEDLPPLTHLSLEAVHQRFVWSEDVGPFPRTRPGYYLTICGLVWMRDESKKPQQMPLFSGGAL